MTTTSKCIMSAIDTVIADWPAPARVRTLITTRQGGISETPYASFNLATHVGDRPEAVAGNRAQLRSMLPAEPAWLNQTHSTRVICPEHTHGLVDADASHSAQAGTVCVVMTADCLPVLFCDQQGTRVAAAHAGWRGLCNGILEQTVTALQTDPARLMAWFGPAIGPDAFEVGAEVRQAFVSQDAASVNAFNPIADGKYLANLYQLARQRLQRMGLTAIYGGNFCTVIERDRFFSYRRDGKTGRMASLIWLDSGSSQ